MAKRSAARALGALTRAFTAPEFLARTELSREGALALLETVDWPRELEARLPAARRFSCGEVRDLCRPLLDALAPEPEEGWLSAAYRCAVGILYPEGAEAQPLPVRPLWRQLPAILPAVQMTSPSSTTATTCRSDSKRSIR